MVRKMTKEQNYDVVIAGCGVAGLYTALSLPRDMKILMLSKEDIASCDSMLAQGGICVVSFTHLGAPAQWGVWVFVGVCAV